MRMAAITQLLRPAALCLLLTACSGGEGGGDESGRSELSAADSAKAQSMLKQYQAARDAGNPEVAEAAADKLRERFPDSGVAAQTDATLEKVRADAQLQRDARRLRGLWDYQANAVGKGTQFSASIFSHTADLGDEQAAPIPDAQMVLRDHPDWGRSAYLLLAQAKFTCGKPCQMQIAFDDAPAQTWAGKQADSGKGPALFIEDEPKFVAALQAGKRVRIELPKGSGHIPALVFEVGGFEAARYAKP